MECNETENRQAVHGAGCLSAAGLLGYNRWDASRAEKASQEVLGELEQTMQKTITEHRQQAAAAASQPVLDPAQEMTTATEMDSWDLTLFTCTSGGNARYAVRCVRTGYPVRVTDTAE